MAVADIVGELACSPRTVLRDLKAIRREMPSTPSDHDKQAIIARHDHIRSPVWWEVDRTSTFAARLRALSHAKRTGEGIMQLLLSLGVIAPWRTTPPRHLAFAR
jgi:hypothetical protein